MSTAYYAIFHCLAEEAANGTIGGTESVLSTSAWRHVYRALDHSTVRNACLNTAFVSQLPPPSRMFANLLPRLQSKRHQADYDPHVRFSRTDAVEAIDDCEAAILAFAAAPEPERRAFVAYVLFKTR